MSISGSGKQKVVIAGAGFAGLWAARRLARRDARRLVDVVLIDRNNYHTFPPLLYQVAAAELEPESIAYPIRGIFRDTPNVTTVMAEITDIDIKNRTVVTDGLSYAYDHLILASGSLTAHYTIPGAEENTFGLKTLEEAVALRNHILACFERAAMEGSGARSGLTTVVVVGAGATGLEYAGALAELMASPLARDFPTVPRHKAKVILMDAAPDVLMPFRPELREYARKKLRAMGVDVMTGAGVAKVRPDAVELVDGTVVEACTIVWSAGVRGNDLGKIADLPLGRGGRVAVAPTLQVAGRPEIQVAGDLSLPEGSSVPMVAPNAIQQGTHAARNVLLAVKGLSPTEFVYKDKGSMVTIGRSAAVAQLGKRQYTGFPAWVLWLFVHLLYLIGFRNKLLAVMGWAWDYLFFDRAVRLIMPRVTSVLAICGTKDSCDSPFKE